MLEINKYSLTDDLEQFKDTRVDGGQFEAGQVLDAERDGEGDNSDIKSNEKTHEPDDQRYAPRRLTHTTMHDLKRPEISNLRAECCSP